jgi:3'(2'), 5'-bisphosphate nucleotidase
VLLSHATPSPYVLEYLKQVRVASRTPIASAYKFCVMAEGLADLYPRFGPTMEWDTAAGHALLQGAGGDIKQPDGSALVYGKPGFRNGPFIAMGQSTLVPV